MTQGWRFPLSVGEPVDGRRLADFWSDQRSATPTVSKVSSLPAAITSALRPDDVIYMGGSLARPNAAAFELTRQFYGSGAQFTLVAPAVANQHAVLVHAGLVKKVITSLHGNTYPGPGPNAVFTAADTAGRVQFEDWSLLTLVLRLYAAATNVPFLPTRSLIGTDLGRELAESGQLTILDDPFGQGPPTALVPALHPDVTIVHSLMADSAGNAVISPPYYDDTWAAVAARRHVIVTTERIVSTDVIRRYAHFVKVPGIYVSAVCEVPFGSHPNQLPGELVSEVAGYQDDYAFLAELREVARDPQAMDDWMQKWVLGLSGHAEYLRQLGPDRLNRLRDDTRRDGWLDELPVLLDRWSAPPTDGELNVVLGARYLQRLVVESNLRVGLAGVGVSTLSAWLAAQALRAADVPFELAAEGGMFGFTPLPLDPYLFNYRNVFTSAALSNVQTILDIVIGGHGNRAVGVLGAAQVDQHGAINSSRIGGRMLTGSGGANDIASTASAVVVTTSHSRQRLPEFVDYVTSPGDRVRAIVTDRAVMERADPGGPFLLTGVLDRGQSKEDLIRAALDRCGWPLKVCDDVELLAAVRDDELAAVRVFDPAGNFVL
jgi:acyl CoA:acetate/3-ketoacid CoA transferase alpha subunit/acyl CoA:acetate/3-ketoacid CoA transferase beta subunit